MLIHIEVMMGDTRREGEVQGKRRGVGQCKWEKVVLKENKGRGHCS